MPAPSCACMLSHVRLFATLWTVACQAPAPLPMEFSRQEYWNGLLLPPPGDLPNPRIKSASPALAADSSPLTCSSEITFIQYVRTLSMSQTPLFHLSISWVAPISPWCIGFCKFTFDIPLSLSRLSKP